MWKSEIGYRSLNAIFLSSFLFTAVTWASNLGLFSEQKSAEENRLAIIEKYGEWINEYDRKACSFEFYEGKATPVFFLQWFLGSALESKMHYAECGEGQNSASHILLEVKSPSRPKQKFSIGMRSVYKSGDRWPYLSEAAYASKSSFIESVEENQGFKTIYSVHHKYRNKPAEVERGEIQYPADLANRAHTYASLIAHIVELVNFNDHFRFVLTDPYSAAIQDEALDYPMWRNEPFQVIQAKRNDDGSINMQGWFLYAFGQLYANINLCFGQSKLPDLIKYHHPFMDVDLWRLSGATLNSCKEAHDKLLANKQKSRFSRPRKNFEK